MTPIESKKLSAEEAYKVEKLDGGNIPRSLNAKNLRFYYSLTNNMYLQMYFCKAEMAANLYSSSILMEYINKDFCSSTTKI